MKICFDYFFVQLLAGVAKLLADQSDVLAGADGLLADVSVVQSDQSDVRVGFGERAGVGWRPRRRRCRSVVARRPIRSPQIVALFQTTVETNGATLNRLRALLFFLFPLPHPHPHRLGTFLSLQLEPPPPLPLASRATRFNISFLPYFPPPPPTPLLSIVPVVPPSTSASSWRQQEKRFFFHCKRSIH